MKVETLRSGARIVQNQFESPFITLKFSFNVGMGDDFTNNENKENQSNEENQSMNEMNLFYSKAHVMEHLVAGIPNDDYKEIKGKFLDFEAFTYDDRTEYSVKVKSEDLGVVAKFLNEKIFTYKMDEEKLRKELEVISIESVIARVEYAGDYFTSGINSNNFIDHFALSPAEVREASKFVKSESMNKMRDILADPKLMIDFYNKYYKPEMMIVSLNGGNEKDFNIIKNCIDDYHKNESDPVVRSITKNKPDTLIGLPESKYKINTIPGDVSQYVKLGIFLPAYDKKDKNTLKGILYSHFITSGIYGDRTGPLSEYVRERKASAYGYYSNVFDFGIEKLIAIEVFTNAKNAHKSLSAVRHVVNKMTDSKFISKSDFFNLKASYYAKIKNDIILNNATSLDNTIIQLFRSTKYKGLEKLEKKIKDITYDEFMDYSKYVAKSNDFKITCLGNNVSYEDLKVFEYKNKPKSVTRKEYGHDLTKDKIKNIIKNKDYTNMM